jgi:protein disulfide-isomerase
MLNLTAPALIFGATALLAQPSLADETWFYEFDAAAAAAAESGKDLLVDFTGSDWCGWCHKLNDEVFDHQVFLDGVADQYVLVKLDFPRSDEAKAKVPNPDRNAELRDAHGVRGYPTILLMTWSTSARSTAPAAPPSSASAKSSPPSRPPRARPS